MDRISQAKQLIFEADTAKKIRFIPNRQLKPAIQKKQVPRSHAAPAHIEC